MLAQGKLNLWQFANQFVLTGNFGLKTDLCVLNLHLSLLYFAGINCFCG